MLTGRAEPGKVACPVKRNRPREFTGAVRYRLWRRGRAECRSATARLIVFDIVHIGVIKVLVIEVFVVELVVVEILIVFLVVELVLQSLQPPGGHRVLCHVGSVPTSLARLPRNHGRIAKPELNACLRRGCPFRAGLRPIAGGRDVAERRIVGR